MNFYNWVMDGDPATAAISNYYAFGGTGFDTSTALSDMLTEATTNNNVRRGTSLENTYGYLPYDLYTGILGCCNVHDSASSLIEYDNADFALSRFAARAGRLGERDEVQRRGPTTGSTSSTRPTACSTRSRATAPSTASPPAPRPGSPSPRPRRTASTSASTSRRLAALYGGNSAINSALDYYFQTFNSSHSDQSFLSNEVDLGTPWFYDWTGEPSHTQSVVNRFLNQLYQDTPVGLPEQRRPGHHVLAVRVGRAGHLPGDPGQRGPGVQQPAVHAGGRPPGLRHRRSRSTLRPPRRATTTCSR